MFRRLQDTIAKAISKYDYNVSRLSILSTFGSETSPKKQQKRKRAFFLNQKLSVISLLVIQYFTQIVLLNVVFIFCFAAVVK